MSTIHRFTLGGVADTALGLQLLRGYADPALPSTRNRTVTIPGRHGAWDFGADLESREMALECALLGATTDSGLAALVRALTAVLLDANGMPVDCALVFTKEPTKTYTVRYSGTLPLARLCGASLGMLSLPLVAHDPYAYGDEVTTAATVTTDGQEVSVSNSGAFRTPPEIRIRNAGVGSVAGFTLTAKAQV